MIIFLTVLLVNLYWLYTDGPEDFIEMYNGGYSKEFSLFVWLYALAGLMGLSYAIASH